MSKVTAGNLVLLEGLEPLVTKTATVVGRYLEEEPYIFKPLRFQTRRCFWDAKAHPPPPTHTHLSHPGPATHPDVQQSQYHCDVQQQSELSLRPTHQYTASLYITSPRHRPKTCDAV